MALIIWLSLLFLGWELTSWLVLQPMDWLGWLHVPHWGSLMVMGLIIAWCLGDE